MAASVLLAAVSAGCGHESGNVLAPSVLGGSEATNARGGGGKPKPGGGGSLTLVLYTDKNGDGLPTWGDTVTFTVSTTATTEPTVSLSCSQNGAVVYGATSGFYDSYPWPWTKNMTLSSGAWTGGAADCTATLFPVSDRSNVLATLTFRAGA